VSGGEQHAYVKAERVQVERGPSKDHAEHMLKTDTQNQA